MSALGIPGAPRLRALAALLSTATCAPIVAGHPMLHEATVREVHDFFAAQQRRVVTFLGYSGAGYEDEPGMLHAAETVLDGLDPAATIVNIGATADGIGAVYPLAKRKGFPTTGIVSSQARATDTPLSPDVDHVFVVADASWGGLVPGTDRLSPTSLAMVENSDVLVAIGGGDVARDELRAAQRLGKSVRFIPADMSHRIAIEKARQKGQPPPRDFAGTAGEAVAPPR